MVFPGIDMNHARYHMVLFFVVCLTLFALCSTNVLAAPATFDFSSLGTPTGGYKPQGNKFLVSAAFLNDISSASGGTVIFYNTGSVTSSGTFTIKADNTNLAAFDLADMRFSVYLNDSISNMIITGTKRLGGTVSQIISAQTMTIFNLYTLSGWGINLAAFTDITALTFDLTMGGIVDYLSFESITLDNLISAASMTTHISSSNTNTLFAKPGDLITISMTTSTAISTPTVTIAGHAATVTGISTGWTATYTMVGGDSDGLAAFSISYSDLRGYSGLPMSGTTASDGSSVTLDKTVPTLSNVHIVSSNTSTNLAKVGDTVSVSFTALETISTPTVTIAGSAATAIFSGGTWTATRVMASGDSEGAVTFSIGSYADAAGNGGTTVSVVTDGSSVTFDKTVPTLSNIHIASNNASTNLAKVGDTVSVSFTASDSISTPTVTIAGSASTAIFSGGTWTATHVMTSGDTAGTVTFSIANYSDAAGNAGATRSAVTDGSTVNFDKIPPALNSASYVDAYHVDLIFTEPVSGATNTINYAADNGLSIIGAVQQSGTTYRLTTSIQAIVTAYTITANTVNIVDAAGNPLSSSAHSAQFIRTNSAPGAPTIQSPLTDTPVSLLTPTLVVNASIDSDGDPVTYTFEVYSAASLTSSSLVATSTTASTSWSPSLTENTTYYWRVLASDGSLSSSWMTVADFFVNATNDAPSDPVVSLPVNSSMISSLTPTLIVINAVDPDKYDVITIDFVVATDGGFSNIISSTSITQGAVSTLWTLPVSLLTDDTPYYWRARARDNGVGALTSNWVSAAFFVNTANSAPAAPVISSPVTGSEVTSLTPVLTIVNSTDADKYTLQYVFEVDTTSAFNTVNKHASGNIAEGSVTTSWIPPTLADNTTHYWRAIAYDGQSYSPAWMATGSFFVNTANDAPGAPTLNNPSNNGQVTVLAPTLQVNASTDPDLDVLAYDYEIYSDSGLTSLVTSTTGAGTNWAIATSLSDNTWYWWRARAKDSHGAASDWMAASRFFVNNGNMIGSGDLNGDYAVDVSDALKSLRFAAGVENPTTLDIAHGDVAPLVNGVPQPDRKIDLGDAVVTLRKAVGLVNW